MVSCGTAMFIAILGNRVPVPKLIVYLTVQGIRDYFSRSEGGGGGVGWQGYDHAYVYNVIL